MKRLSFVADVLRFQKNYSLSGQHQGMTMGCAFEIIESNKFQLNNLIEELKGPAEDMYHFETLKKAIQKSDSPKLTMDEQKQFIEVVQKIIDSFDEIFQDQLILKSISTMIETGECTENQLNDIIKYLSSNTTSEIEKLLLNDKKIEKSKKKQQIQSNKENSKEKSIKLKEIDENKFKIEIETKKIFDHQNNEKKSKPIKPPKSSKEIKEEKEKKETKENKEIRKKEKKLEHTEMMEMVEDEYFCNEKGLNNSNQLKQKLKEELRTLSQINTPLKKEYIIQNKHQFVLLSQLAVALEVIFPTTVSCESGFSLLKYVKTDQRNRMKQETLDSIMRIKYANANSLTSSIINVVNSRYKRVNNC